MSPFDQSRDGGGKVVMFGTGSLSSMLQLYLAEDSDYEVVAFTATADHLTGDSFSGLPLVPFERVTDSHPPSEHRMFIAVGYDHMNRLRSRFYREAKSLGYELITYVSSRAHFRAAAVGDNCCVFEGAIVEPFTTIGNDVIVWGGAHVSHHSAVGDHSFLAPGATIAGHTSVGSHCFLGINATVGDGVSIGDDCLIGAGANIVGDVGPRQVLLGARARRDPRDVDRFFR